MLGKRTAIVLSVSLAVSTVAPAQAGNIRHDRDDADYLALAQQPDFASVGQLFITDGPFAIGLCSATLVAPGWVLTAAHCTNVAEEASDLLFFLDGQARRGTQIELHPSLTDSAPGQVDMALFRLDEEITSVAPAPLYAGSDEIGRLATSVGFGRTGTGLTGAIEGSKGELRAGQNILEDVDPFLPLGDQWLASDFDNPLDPADNRLGSEVPVDLEYIVAPGDSGGGTFVLADDGSWQLAGVHSFLASIDGGLTGDYGDVAVHARVSTALPWIQSLIPAPGTPALLLQLLMRRRR